MNTQPAAGGHAPPALIQGGYILVARQITCSEIWEKPPLYLKVWIYLLTRAQHSSYKGLGPGQLFISIPELQKACAWKIGYRTELPTKDQIFRILGWMRQVASQTTNATTNQTMIATTKATQGMLVEISNYSVYQDAQSYGRNNQANDERAANESTHPTNINKPGKHNKNGNKNSSCSRIKSGNEPSQLHYDLAEHLRSSILRWKPNAKTPGDLRVWADDIRLMMTRDNREEMPIAILIEFATEDPFWRSNILSAAKLREKYDQLEAKMHDIDSKRILATANPRIHEKSRGIVQAGA